MPDSPVTANEIGYLNKRDISNFIKSALKEDVREGDHSTLSTIPQNKIVQAKIVAKDEGVIAGLELAQMIFHTLEKSLQVSTSFSEGDAVAIGDTVMEISGNARSILTAERLVLNCMQRMSGIATKTRRYVDLIKNFKAKLLDTRKTTPNFRMMEKWAVRIGGGTNHRFGLFDMIMLKDNHVDFAGGITQALRSAAEYKRQNGLTELKIEIETRTLLEVQEAADFGEADVIMLDNMMPSVMREAIQIIAGRALTEASGGITEANIQEVAETGVDFISVGALTHSYTSLDLSLKAV